MGRPLIISTNNTVSGHCNEPNTRLMPVHEERIRMAIAEAERYCTLHHNQIKPTDVRLMVANITTLTPIQDGLVDEFWVIRSPRYAVTKRAAPKRPTLISRLLGMLR